MRGIQNFMDGTFQYNLRGSDRVEKSLVLGGGGLVKLYPFSGGLFCGGGGAESKGTNNFIGDYRRA